MELIKWTYRFLGQSEQRGGVSHEFRRGFSAKEMALDVTIISNLHCVQKYYTLCVRVIHSVCRIITHFVKK